MNQFLSIFVLFHTYLSSWTQDKNVFVACVNGEENRPLPVFSAFVRYESRVQDSISNLLPVGNKWTLP